MQRLREQGWLRIVTTVLAFPVLVAISTGVAELEGSDELDGFTAGVFLVPMFVFGMVVAKGWVLVLPALWSALLLTVLRIADLITGECSVCTSDEDWGNYPFFFFAIAVVPMTAALALGVAIGLAPPLRRFRSDSLHRA